MGDDFTDGAVDSLTLRFTGKDKDGRDLHELRAAHVAEVLQGIVGLSSDFDKAGVFNPKGPANSEVLVRPAREGSFIIEVVRVVEDVALYAAPLGVPSLATVVFWATKSARAGVKDFEYLGNGNVKVVWQDDEAQEIPFLAWEELQKRKPRRKKQLRQIMAPLSDRNVSALAVTEEPAPANDVDQVGEDQPRDGFVLARPDYDAAKPEDEVEETQNIFETEAQMSTIDFDDPSKWRVRTTQSTRTAIVEDAAFLTQVGKNLAIRKSDIFQLRIREDKVKKNGTTRTKWTVLQVVSHRTASGDDDL